LPIDAKLVGRLHRRAQAERWRVSVERFTEALERGIERGADPASLHLEDLALACGCAEGDEQAWEHFIREHRPVLYRAADALDPAGGARDLADGLYGELYERSLFKYFHGRSSLSTWLRAVLAQRHVDRIRAGRRFEPLPDAEQAAVAVREQDPERGRCVELIRGALARAVAALAPRDRLRLACYYAQGLTLAETGRLLGEHEATCSRQLARTRKALRGRIEEALKSDARLSDAEIAVCVASVSEDAGTLDLRELLNADEPGERKKIPADRSTLRGIT
jgi:RNA polymerase sigma factor (sigma-70 family)